MKVIEKYNIFQKTIFGTDCKIKNVFFFKIKTSSSTTNFSQGGRP